MFGSDAALLAGAELSLKDRELRLRRSVKNQKHEPHMRVWARVGGGGLPSRWPGHSCSFPCPPVMLGCAPGHLLASQPRYRILPLYSFPGRGSDPSSPVFSWLFHLSAAANKSRQSGQAQSSRLLCSLMLPWVARAFLLGVSREVAVCCWLGLEPSEDLMGQTLMSTHLANLFQLLSAWRELRMGTLPHSWASPRVVVGFQEGRPRMCAPRTRQKSWNHFCHILLVKQGSDSRRPE